MSTGIETLEFSLMQRMTQEQRMMFQMQYSASRKNPDTAFFLALLALSRFYLGQALLGVLQWVLIIMTVGVVWWFIDLFTVKDRTREYNAKKARELAWLVTGNPAIANVNGEISPLVAATPGQTNASAGGFCCHCGTPFPEGASWCARCGQSIVAAVG